MSNPNTLSLQYCIHTHPRNTTGVATDAQPMQYAELRLAYSNQFVSRSSNQLLQQTPQTLISDALLPLFLRDLQHPPFLSHFLVLQFLSTFNISTASSHAIFDDIATFALELAAGDLDRNFHIIVYLDFVQTIWVDLDLDLDLEIHRKQEPAPASVMERVMREEFDGFRPEEAGDCSVCCDELRGETEVRRLPCGHVFHKSCILKWLQLTNSCPLCRAKLEQ
ncbi:E3 ubiquitin-protein ligase-like protein, partial [Cucurbita argyrosperma subsp. sororia]